MSRLCKGDISSANELGAHLVLRLSQQLLLSEVVQSQSLADTRQQPSLERDESRRDVVHFGLVVQFDPPALVEQAVRVQVGLLACPRGERSILTGADDEEAFLRVRVEVDDGDGKRRLVVLEVEFEDGFGLNAATEVRAFFLLRESESGGKLTVTGSMIRMQEPH